MLKFFKNRFFLVSIALVIIGAAVVLSYSFLPVMKIGGEYVAYPYFQKVYGGIEGAERLAKKNPPATGEELTKRAFKTIVENKLVEILIKKTNASLAEVARRNVEQAILESKDLRLEEAAQKLYGLSVADFKKLVLIPAAEQDLLMKHYEYNPSELDALWDDLNSHTEVKIYYPGYEWKDGEVKSKNW